jgi:YfiH family protein
MDSEVVEHDRACVQCRGWKSFPGLMHGTTLKTVLPQPGKIDFFEQVRAARAAGVMPEGWTLGCDQVHGNRIAVVSEPVSEHEAPEGFRHDDALHAGEFPQTDGLITTFPGLLLVIRTADCLPLFLVDPVEKMAGLAHCGWQGLKVNLAAETAGRMVGVGASADVLEAWMGPCIQCGSYEVGTELVESFRKSYPDGEVSPDGMHLDLRAVARQQLLNAGLRPDHIHECDECTFAGDDRFHSYRRDGEAAGRMLSFVGFSSNPSRQYDS